MEMTITMRLLRAYLRAGLRGSSRVTSLLARSVGSLQFVPIKVADCEPFYVDLRKVSHDLLRGTPWGNPPWESAEQEVMRQTIEPGDIVFDIGANIGLHAVLLSKLAGDAGQLCVFEPNPELLPQLRKTIAGLGNANLYPYALSDVDETATLFVPEDDSMGSLADWTNGRAGAIHTMTCEVRRLDDLIEAGIVPRPDFVKCDVEGAELMVFRGGERSLDREDAPIILFEANVHNTRGFGLEISAAKSYLSGIRSAEFQFFDIREDGSLGRQVTTNSVHSNILAVPRARSNRL